MERVGPQRANVRAIHKTMHREDAANRARPSRGTCCLFTSAAQRGDNVYKVGRTTGLTRGTVTQVPVVVGPIPYDPGDCWFRRAIRDLVHARRS